MKISKKLLSSLALVSTAGVLVPISSCACNSNGIVALVITKKPNKLNYAKGQYLDLTGLEVKAVKADGSSETTTDYTVDVADKTRLNDVGTKTITVKLNNTNLTDTFTIEVGQAIVSKLEITQYPEDEDLIFNINDQLILKGLKITATKSDDSVIDDFKDYKTTPEIGSTLKEWGRNTITFSADGASCQLDVLVITQAVKFSECLWEMVADWAFFVEKGVIDESYFCKHFLKEDGKTPFSSFKEFIGQEKAININGVSHAVKIIDVQHDTIDSDLVEENTKALFTFQLFNKVSDDKGDGYITEWIEQDQPLDYTTSQLRYNLDKKGDETRTIKWADAHSTETKSLFEMLPSEFENYIWPVKKTVAVQNKEKTAFALATYTDRIFVPTLTEYGFDEEQGSFMVEGTKYEYWKAHPDKSDRIIKDVNGSNLRSYYLSTPHIAEKSTNVYAITNNGEKGKFMTYNVAQAVVPCFCI